MSNTATDAVVDLVLWYENRLTVLRDALAQTYRLASDGKRALPSETMSEIIDIATAALSKDARLRSGVDVKADRV